MYLKASLTTILVLNIRSAIFLKSLGRLSVILWVVIRHYLIWSTKHCPLCLYYVCDSVTAGCSRYLFDQWISAVPVQCQHKLPNKSVDINCHGLEGSSCGISGSLLLSSCNLLIEALLWSIHFEQYWDDWVLVLQTIHCSDFIIKCLKHAS